MSKLNTGNRLVTNPLRTEAAPTGKTHLGHAGFRRDPQTELFMRATTVFAGEDQFHEAKDKTDAAAVALIRQLAVEDWRWVQSFLPWLRTQGNIRTSSVMLAAEAVHARGGKDTGFGLLTCRQLTDAVLQRADEPGEMIQYCLRTWGKVPVAVRKGVGDAVLRLWGERAVIRWDKPDRPMRFADVIELSHPRPWTKPDPGRGLPKQPRMRASRDLLDTIPAAIRAEMTVDDAVRFLDAHERDLSHRREVLFKWLLDERHDRAGEVPVVLEMTAARRRLSAMPPNERHAMAGRALDNREGRENREIRQAAAGQWEWTSSWLGEGVRKLGNGAFPDGTVPLTDRQRWELVIPWMGYMALLRNLRNFEQAGVRQSILNKVAQRLASPKEVAGSRQLPFRFLSAWLNTRSMTWGPALEQALQHSLPNVPLMSEPGLLLVDMSGSMYDPMGTDMAHRERLLKAGRTPPEYPKRYQAALVFAVALAARNAGKADVYAFADRNMRILIDQGTSVLRAVTDVAQAATSRQGGIGGGTRIAQNLAATFDKRRHRWVAVFTDEQCLPGGPSWDPWRAQRFALGDVTTSVPADVPLFAWNLAGYEHGMMPTGTNRYALAGLTDHSFAIMDRIMHSRNGLWPWDMETARPVFDEDEDE